MANGVMKGISVCREGPKLSHLFFANDSLIFRRASLEDCDELQRVLGVVEGHLWKAQWKEKPNDEGRKKLTM